MIQQCKCKTSSSAHKTRYSNKLRSESFSVPLQSYPITSYSTMRFFVPILFLSLLILSLSYCSWRIYHVLPFSNSILRAFISLLPFVLTLGSVTCFMVGFDRIAYQPAVILYEICTSWIIILLYIFLAFLLIDVLRLIHLLPSDILTANWKTLGTLTVLLASLFVYGNIHYQHKYREEITLPTHGKVLKPTKIVLLSDLHLGYHNRAETFKKWISLINKENADAILIAGDIIDISIRPLLEENIAELFHTFNAPVYASLGNHEYFSGEPRAKLFFRDAHIMLLRDTALTLPANILVVGRDDRTNPHRASTKQILASVHKNDTLTAPYSILLDHQPYHLEESEEAGIDFQFSGHTHHGQVWPISWITDLIYEDAFGFYSRGDTNYYVSSGLGIWGGKFRIGTRSEYVVLTLLP